MKCYHLLSQQTLNKPNTNQLELPILAGIKSEIRVTLIIYGSEGVPATQWHKMPNLLPTNSSLWPEPQIHRAIFALASAFGPKTASHLCAIRLQQRQKTNLRTKGRRQSYTESHLKTITPRRFIQVVRHL